MEPLPCLVCLLEENEEGRREGEVEEQRQVEEELVQLSLYVC